MRPSLSMSGFLHKEMFLLEEKNIYSMPPPVSILSWFIKWRIQSNTRIEVLSENFLSTPQAWGSWSLSLYRKAVTIFTCLSNWEHCLAAHSGLLDKCVQYSLISWWDNGQSILRMWTEWKPQETVGLFAAYFFFFFFTLNNEQRFCSTGYAVAPFLQ